MKLTAMEVNKKKTVNRRAIWLSFPLCMAWMILAPLCTETLQAQTQIDYTTVGTGYSLRFPGGVTVIAEFWGGGGGGGGARGAGASAGGGGGGGYIKKTFTLSASTTFTLDVGAGGTAGATPAGDASSGGRGGDSQICIGASCYTALGGNGGGYANGLGSNGSGGAGGGTSVPAAGADDQINGTNGASGSGGSGGGASAYSGGGIGLGFGGNGGRVGVGAESGNPGMAGAMFFTVTFPSSIVITSSSTLLCGGNSTPLSVQNPYDGVVYIWYRNGATTGYTGATYTATTTGDYSVQGLFPITYSGGSPSFTPALLSGGVSVSSNTITLTQGPVIQFNPFSLTGCSGDAFSVTPVSGQDGNNFPSGTVYSWTIASNAGGITGATGGSSSTGAISLGTLANPTNTSQTVVYDVVPSGGGCTGDIFKITVEIKPIPKISSISQVICSGQNLTITPLDGANGVIPSGTTYSWTVASANSNIEGAQSGTSGGTSSIDLGILINSATTTQTVTYQVTPFCD